MLGGVPSVIPDIPICACLLACYISFAVTNMTIFQKNRIRKYKFFPTVFLFGFCMARVATLVLRIAWATRPHNVRLAIAANILVNAGILIVYVLNLVFAQRILRAEQPKLGWNPILNMVFKVLYALIGGVLAMVITSAVLSVYTLNMDTLHACRDVQHAAITYLLVFVTLPIFLLAVAQFLPTPPGGKESFGQGGMATKKLTILTSSCLAILIAGFKTGTAWMPPRLKTHPYWFDSKACFYVFNFACEILILFVLTVSRPDKRFYVPDHSKGPGDYTRLRSSHGNHGTEDAAEEATEIGSEDRPSMEKSEV